MKNNFFSEINQRLNKATERVVAPSILSKIEIVIFDYLLYFISTQRPFSLIPIVLVFHYRDSMSNVK